MVAKQKQTIPYHGNLRKYERIQIDCSQDGLTHQSFKDECDINFIMKKYIETGYLDPSLLKKAEYMDAQEITFQDAMLIVKQAQSDFDSLPSALRKRFGNDPANFLDFVSDESNVDQMREMGLLPPLTESIKQAANATPSASGEEATSRDAASDRTEAQ